MKRKILLVPLIIIVVLLSVFVVLAVRVKPDKVVQTKDVQPVEAKAGDLPELKIAAVGKSVSEGAVSQVYAFKTKDNSVIQIGTERHSPSKPYLKMDKWDGEVSLKIRMPFETGDNPQVIGNKLRYSTADALASQGQALRSWVLSHLFPAANAQAPTQPRVDIEIYPKLADSQNENGGVEFDTILYEKPSTNQIVFPLETTNLDFFYQPPLSAEASAKEDVKCTETECKDKDGNITDSRPENVVGSYAVYYKDGKSGDFSQMGGKNYRAGKAFHIYRPKITDATGKEVWGNLAIDPSAGSGQGNLTMGNLIVEIPQDFLNTAAYPVTIDPTFGYTTVAGTNFTLTQNRITAGGDAFTGAAGTGTSMSFYCSGTNFNVQMGVYDATDLINNSSTASVLVNSTQQWWTANSSSPTFATASYFLAMVQDTAGGSTNARYDTGGSATTYNYYNGTFGTWPDPITWSTFAFARRFSIYVTYTLPTVNLNNLNLNQINIHN